jgi:protein involved in polysaccharide export with SLBB domain
MLTARALVNLLMLSGFCLAGCALHTNIVPSHVEGFAPWVDDTPQHKLASGDEIELKFLFNTELNDKLTIGPDGRVTVPLLGPVQAEGMTIPAFTGQLEKAYASKLRVPNLDVVMRNYGSSRIFVGGEVKAPGVLAMAGPTDVLQGVLLAGGFLASARSDEVVVIRRRPDHTPMLRTVDVHHMIGHADPNDDFPLQSADVVYVPKSSIAEFDQFIDQYINQALPFQRGINYNIGNGGVIF